MTLNQGRSRKVARLQLNSTDEDVVRRFAAIIPGVVCGPYVHGKRADGANRKPYWVWICSGQEKIERAMEMLSPWFGERRLARARELGLLNERMAA